MQKLISVLERLGQDDINPPESIVSGLLFRNTFVVLGAPEDSFKTSVAIQLSISLAAGIPFFIFSCKPSVIAYLALEGGVDYVLERIEERVDALSLDRDSVLSRIFVQDCSGMQLDNPNTALAIKETLKAMNPKPDLVIFDPITYAMSEDNRFSPERTKLCNNLIGIAHDLNGVALAILHCRKGSQDNDNMDDLLGSSVIAAAAATRIKLYRSPFDRDKVNMYSKTRYAEQPEEINLRWKYPLLEVTPEQLKPREQAKRTVLEVLNNTELGHLSLGVLIEKVEVITKFNPKTIRAAITNLELDGEVQVMRIPGTAIKLVIRIPEGEPLVN